MYDDDEAIRFGRDLVDEAILRALGDGVRGRVRLRVEIAGDGQPELVVSGPAELVDLVEAEYDRLDREARASARAAGPPVPAQPERMRDEG